MGLDHPLVRAAIDELVAHDVVVVTLVSDVPGSQRSRFVGIDNVTAGRTAASLLGRFVGPRAGQVGMSWSRRALADHAERLFGFERVMAAEYGHLRLLPPSKATISVGGAHRAAGDQAAATRSRTRGSL